MSEPQTFFDEIGGHVTFSIIVKRFYAEVATDPVLRRLYPEQDLEPARMRMQTFLEQYWGGPRTYSDNRGHPRLRLRHQPFRIGRAEHDAWLTAMGKGVDEARLDPQARQRLWEYLVMAADSLVNTVD